MDTINKSIEELRSEKEKELKGAIKKRKLLEDEINRTKWNRHNIENHKKILRDLNEVSTRIAELHDFLKELDLGSQKFTLHHY